MTANVIPTWQIMQFNQKVELLLQQPGGAGYGELTPFVTTGNYEGKQASVVDQYGKVEAQEVTSRFAPKTRTDANVDRRWVYPKDYDLTQMFDTFDKLRIGMSDPKSPAAPNAAEAMGRKKDLNVVNAFFADAKTGEQGGTTTVWATANVVGVNIGGTATKLNVAKLRAAKLGIAKKYFGKVNEPIFLGITQNDNDALLNEIQITSQEFNPTDKPVLEDGVVKRFLGINFVPYEAIETLLIGTDDQSHAGSVALPLWTPSGMHLGTWMDVNTSPSIRTDLQGDPWQLYTMGTFGATRLNEDKVWKVWSYR